MAPWFLRPRAVRLAGLGFLSLGLLILATGCPGGQKKSIDMAEVSGKVMFGGQPLPGGRITFISKDSPQFTGGGNINENGEYKVEAPVGDVKVTVDNQMLAPGGGAGGKGGKGPDAPAIKPGLKRPGSEAPISEKGHYVPIPAKYANSEETPLTFKINKGSQTIQIDLKE